MKRFIILLMSFIMVVTMNVGCKKQGNNGDAIVDVDTTKTDTTQESTSEV
ncbi:MAG: hypothetical protein H7X94_04970, partial [Vallitaleaceae bacterium]|nr:hypothetical protein [Vallitaleaceae bacterium]